MSDVQDAPAVEAAAPAPATKRRTVLHAVRLLHTDGSETLVKAGEQDLPVEIADHWGVIANSTDVEPVEPQAGTAAYVAAEQAKHAEAAIVETVVEQAADVGRHAARKAARQAAAG